MAALAPDLESNGSQRVAGPLRSDEPLRFAEIAERIARHLAQATPCSVSGVLLLHDHGGHMALFRCRPVDDLFLQAVQRRLSLSYQVCTGLVATNPPIEVKVYGDAVPGPYEPPRSILTMPILFDGRVAGMVTVASVFAEAFGSQDLCTMSALAAQASDVLAGLPLPPGSDLLELPALGKVESTRGQPTSPGSSSSDQGADAVLQGLRRCRVGPYLKAIVDLANEWQGQVEEPLSEVLRQDLDAILQNALRIQKLLTH